MTDREALDDQIFRTFVGCGIAGEKTPRAANGKVLKTLLQENHRFVFSLVHKFNQPVKPEEPYSKRDDIMVISDEAHRTQSGKPGPQHAPGPAQRLLPRLHRHAALQA
jgi:type I restriction enzyme R subunit